MKETTAIDVRDEQRRLKLIKFGQLAIAWKQAWRRKISQEAIVLQSLGYRKVLNRIMSCLVVSPRIKS